MPCKSLNVELHKKNIKSVKRIKISCYERNDKNRKEKWNELIRNAEKRAINKLKCTTVSYADSEQSFTQIDSNNTFDLKEKHIRFQAFDKSKNKEMEGKHCPWDLIVNLEGSTNAFEAKANAKKQMMYRKFLEAPEQKAAVWRPDRSLSGKQRLHEKVQIQENRVASKFLSWLNSLGGVKTSLTVNRLTELFQFGMANKASSSIICSTKEFSTLPQQVAVANKIPKKSQQYILRRHILWNIHAENRKKEVVAFYKYLPRSRRYVPPKNNTFSEWVECKTIQKELQDMSETFSDKLHLQSVFGFCKWLNMNKIDLPEYLQNMGMLNYIQ